MQAPNLKKTRRFYSFGPYRLYTDGELLRGNDPLPLPPKSADVLLALVTRRGRLATKEALLREAWPDTFVEESSLSYQVSQLRKTLGKGQDGRAFIETIPKRGYRFAAPITESWEEEQVESAPPVDESARLGAEPGGERSSWAVRGAVLLAVLLAGIAGGAWVFRPEIETPVRRFEVTPPVALFIANGVHPNIALSPDGSRIAYVARDRGRLWIHDMEKGESQPLEGGSGADDPFWSPPGDRLAYFAGASIRSLPVDGGASTLVYERKAGVAAPEGHGIQVDSQLRGGAWSPDGQSIVFSESGSLYEVPAHGGSAKLLVSPSQPGDALRWPRFLPVAGRRTLLYTAGTLQDRVVVLHDLDSGKRISLCAGELPVYSPTGHILFQAGPRDYEVWALPVSLRSLESAGAAFKILPSARLPMVSEQGTLVYLDAEEPVWKEGLVWKDRQGRDLTRISEEHHLIVHVELSPDDRRVAVAADDDGSVDIWIHEVERPAKMRLTTHPLQDIDPVWSSSGDRIAFASSYQDIRGIYTQLVSAGRAPAPFVRTAGVREFPTDWAKDDELLVCTRVGGGSVTPELVLYRRRAGSPDLEGSVLRRNARNGKLSPDRRYIAYESAYSGRYEVYVQSFPGGEEQTQVSTNGGAQARWGPDGTELFYVEGQSLMAAPISTGRTLEAGAPERLFSARRLQPASESELSAGIVTYDVASDGQRFVVRQTVQETQARIRVVQNWHREFRER